MIARVVRRRHHELEKAQKSASNECMQNDRGKLQRKRRGKNNNTKEISSRIKSKHRACILERSKIRSRGGNRSVKSALP